MKMISLDVVSFVPFRRERPVFVVERCSLSFPLPEEFTEAYVALGP